MSKSERQLNQSDVLVDAKGLNQEAYLPPTRQSVEPSHAGHGSSPLAFSRLSPAVTTDVYDTYWQFAAERQRIFFKRLAGTLPPWTQDHVLQRYRFTNAYRASDRVSQYLIKHVIYEGDQAYDEVFFRIVLFKVFNRIETWEALRQRLGSISFATYSFDAYSDALSGIVATGRPIFTAAYVMPSGTTSYGYRRKHQNCLKLLEHLMMDEVPARAAVMKSMRNVFELLRSFPMLGDFLAYQLTIDINYSCVTDFSENEFVVPGPGARDGIRKCFTTLGGLTETDIIRMVANRQDEEFAHRGIRFPTLWGRRLQLIDCQNLFCEVDKYARVVHPNSIGRSGRTRIKQRFRSHPEGIAYWYPPKWQINEMVERGCLGCTPNVGQLPCEMTLTKQWA